MDSHRSRGVRFGVPAAWRDRPRRARGRGSVAGHRASTSPPRAACRPGRRCSSEVPWSISYLAVAAACFANTASAGLHIPVALLNGTVPHRHQRSPLGPIMLLTSRTGCAHHLRHGVLHLGAPGYPAARSPPLRPHRRHRAHRATGALRTNLQEVRRPSPPCAPRPGPLRPPVPFDQFCRAT